METEAPCYTWRRTSGAAPDAVKVARPVLNGGDEETGLCRPRLVATQHHASGTVLAYVFGRRKEICQSYYDPRERLYRVAVCGNHECSGFVKALTGVSTSARRRARRERLCTPDNGPPRLCPS